MTIRVLIADDQELVRGGFRMILDNEPDIEVVADVGDGAHALERARTLRPDVCLLDIRMPEPDGLEVTRRLAGPTVRDPLKVVVVTTFDIDEYVYTALTNGASGFLLKDAGPTLLVEAVRAAVRGDALISPAITVRLLEHFAGPQPKPQAANPRPTGPVERLTGREDAVLHATAQGLTNQEIADRLHISLSTVKTHLSAIQTKLDARNRVEIATWAYRSGRMDR